MEIFSGNKWTIWRIKFCFRRGTNVAQNIPKRHFCTRFRGCLNKFPEIIKQQNPALLSHLRQQRGIFALLDLERIMGVEPTTSAWEANVLPINYIRDNDRRTE